MITRQETTDGSATVAVFWSLWYSIYNICKRCHAKTVKEETNSFHRVTSREPHKSYKY